MSNIHQDRMSHERSRTCPQHPQAVERTVSRSFAIRIREVAARGMVVRSGQRIGAPGGLGLSAHKPKLSVEALRSLWESKRAGRVMPARYDFVIDDLAPWLGRLNLVSLDKGVARFDVFGTYNSRDLGIELTGRTVDALPAEDRNVTRAGIDRAVQEKAPVFETISLVRNHRLKAYDRLILPLSDDG
ncbi:MAG: PAS domain-containing protein, partial [Alphaproteobacteria bacterium]|nr:PAS domain-containing protein [Alphaproteobacteria bacterium]